MKKKIFSVLFIAAFAFAGCNQNNESAASNANTEGVTPEAVANPSSADGSVDAEKVPVMTFEKEKHDFGTITDGEKVSYSFSFTNTGKAPLVISHASATCGCTVPKHSNKPVQPGEKGFIEVTFDSSNKPGFQEKRVTITANTIPTENYVTITADVKKP